MKNFELNLDSQEMLSKDQMKNIVGGRWPICTWSWTGAPGCASGSDSIDCTTSTDPNVCQTGADNNCDHNDCCSDVDCV